MSKDSAKAVLRRLVELAPTHRCGILCNQICEAKEEGGVVHDNRPGTTCLFARAQRLLDAKKGKS